MVTIATLGSHSALDVCEGAKREGLGTIVVCQKGRERTYEKFYRSRKRGERTLGVVDETITLERFSEIVERQNLDYLKKRNAIFVPNRSFSVYVGYDNIEKRFEVPIFGNRYLLRAEERDAPKNQHYLLKKATIPMPREIGSPEKIDTLSVIKVQEAKRSYERAFFIASSYEEYKEKSERLLKEGKINEEGLKKAKIEEFVIGAHFNFNFFYSGLYEELELIGVDTRRQTNADGFYHMTADRQLEALRKVGLTNIEVGHLAATIRESLLENILVMGERFVETVEKEYKDGLRGPFALQGIVEERDGTERFVVFDVSFRMPGSPGIQFTPYTEYLLRESMNMGRRVAIEIKEAEKIGKMEKVVT